MRRIACCLWVVAAWACDDQAEPVGGRPDGAATDGAAVDGAAIDAAADSARPDAARPDGATPDATPPDGAIPDGAPPDGSIPDGALPDAAAPDGAPLDAATPDAGPDPDAGPHPAEWFACNAPTDCVVFEAECCDHCNDGRAVAVNRAHEAAARAAIQDVNCGGVACTERACAPAAPTCTDGGCGWVPDPAFADPCFALEEEACEANAACRPIRGAPAAEICVEDFAHWGSVYGGCIPADMGCGEAETCAIRPGDGRRFVFPDTCTPFNWAGCDPCAIGECARGFAEAPARICVRGEMGDDGERLEAGAIRVEVYPGGCHSSSCTHRLDVACAVADDLSLTAQFCIAGVAGAEVCTDDCGGAGWADCVATEVAEGRHTFTLGGLSVTVDVPSVVPFGGACGPN